MKVILISGKAGSGKDQSGKFLTYLLEKYAFSVQQMSFAKRVKEISKEVFGWDGVKDDKGRALLQAVGHAGRAYDIDFWVKDIVKHMPKVDFIIISDWRFPSEKNYLRSLAFEVTTIRIFSPVRATLLDSKLGEDSSETSLTEERDEYDYYIENLGTLDELEASLEKVCLDIIEGDTENEYR